MVDDEENLRLVLGTLLRRNGYEVETACSGEEALALVDSFGPDFVLTDVRMPKMGGLDLLATLKEIREITDRNAHGVKETRGGTDDLLQRASALVSLTESPGRQLRANGGEHSRGR